MTTEQTGQHTPGAWVAHGTNINAEGDGYQYLIASTNKSPVPTEEAYTNARLIAAGPEMYDYILIQARRGDMQAQGIINQIEGK